MSNADPTLPSSPFFARSKLYFRQGVEKGRALIRSPLFIFLITLLILGGFNLIFYGEIILEGNGFGYEEGAEFKELVLNFPERIGSHQVLKYYVQRAVPSFVLHYSFQILGIAKPSDRDIINGFRAYNLALLILAVVIWQKITEEMKLSPLGRWAAYIGLFVNVFVLKLYFYRPVFTDQTAFVLGVLLLYFYLKRQWLGFWITVIVGSFTWQTMIYYGIVLFLFSKPTPEREKPFLFSHLRLDVVLTGIAVVWLLQTLREGFGRGLEDKWWILDKSVIYLSILIACVYLWLVLRSLLNFPSLYQIKDHIISLISVNLPISIAVFWGVNAVINTYGLDSAEYVYMRLFVRNAVYKAIGAPAVFLVSHIVYFGPLVLLTVFFWKDIVKQIQRFPIGLTLFFVGNMILSLSSESRFLTAAFPFFVIFTIKALDSIELKPAFVQLFFVISFLFSKVWYRINVAIQEGFADAYMMNYGPWMSPQMYVVQGCAVLCAALVLYYVLHHHQEISLPKGER